MKQIGVDYSKMTLLTVVVTSLLLTACATNPPILFPAPTDSERQAVLTPPEHIPQKILDEPGVNLLATNGGMRWFVETYVGDKGSQQHKFERLFNTLRNNPEFAVEYKPNETRSAAQVFARRSGNCLSFSAMFVALAREAGLEAYFQEVDVPPAWDAAGVNTLIQYRHVNVKVKLRNSSDGIVDFRMDRYREEYPKRVISDEEALGHYYSNVSMDHLIEGDFPRAYVAAKRAVEANPSSGFIWNNMGIVLRRLGKLEEAKIAYRQALQLDNLDWTAVNNLAYILELEGDIDRSAELRQTAEQFKLRNPYYRFALAQAYYTNGEYDQAYDHVNAAVGSKRGEHRFYFLRGLSLWRLGDSQAAIADVKRAIKIGERDRDNMTGVLTDYEQQLAQWQHNNG